MTIKAAASAIIDDLVDSGSFLRTQVSACDYGVMDTNGGCAVIVRPGNSTFEQIGYGGVELENWGLVVQGYVRDTGNVVEFLGRVYDMHDALRGAINAGSNANTQMMTSKIVSMLHSPDVSFISPGGNDFALVTANVTVREDP